MSGSLATATANAVLDRIFSAAAYTPAVTYYVALYSVAPTDAGGGTELAGGAYARVEVTNNAANFPAAAARAKSNGTAITFPQATAAWTTAVAFGLHSAAVADTLVAWGHLTVPVTVAVDEIKTFAVGDLDLTVLPGT